MTTNVRDPRSIVTPDAFDVSEEMLGLPLATPARRAGAMGIDLVVIGLITAFVSGWGYFLWGVIGLAMLQLAFRTPAGSWTEGQLGRVSTWMVRGSIGCLGALVLLIVGLVWLGSRDDFREAQIDRAIGGLAEQGIQVEGIEDFDDLPELARQLEGLAPSAPASAVDSVLTAEAAALDPSEVAAALVTLEAGDAPDSVEISAGMIPADVWEATLRGRAVELFASDTVGALERTAESRAARIEELREDLAVAEEEADTGFFALVRDVFGQLGSAFGVWTLYFTVATVVLKGRTVGKLATRIRVVRLDGQPLTWLPSLERAGGYAAGIATGLMGFMQVFWDRNRQCVHDRIAGTVVVMDGVSAIPGSWKEVWTETDEPEEPRR